MPLDDFITAPQAPRSIEAMVKAGLERIRREGFAKWAAAAVRDWRRRRWNRTEARKYVARRIEAMKRRRDDAA